MQSSQVRLTGLVIQSNPLEIYSAVTAALLVSGVIDLAMVIAQAVLASRLNDMQIKREIIR